jgi:hypothetical protein
MLYIGEQPVSRTVDNRLRRLAKKRGYRLTKSRQKLLHYYCQGGYRLIEPHQNAVIAGEYFELTPGDVESLLFKLGDNRRSQKVRCCVA